MICLPSLIIRRAVRRSFPHVQLNCLCSVFLLLYCAAVLVAIRNAEVMMVNVCAAGSAIVEALLPEHAGTDLCGV
jgi:amino acid permease